VIFFDNEKNTHMKRNRFNEYGQRNQYRDDHFYDIQLHDPDDRYDEPGYERWDREQEMRGRNREREQQDHRRRRSTRFHPEYISLYGEHPDSRGAEEYFGGNKRHPGLGAANYRNRERSRIPYRDRNEPFPRRTNRRRAHHLREPHYLRRREYNDYMNRGQYELPFQPREMYDPGNDRGDAEFDMDLDHLYQEQGAQDVGGLESFGKRGRRQHGFNWMQEDEYPEGHRNRKEDTENTGLDENSLL
jgi:hypothetical protein